MFDKNQVKNSHVLSARELTKKDDVLFLFSV